MEAIKTKFGDMEWFTTPKTIKSNNMTEIQQKLLAYYKAFHKEHKCPPTTQMAADLLKMKRQTIAYHIKNLVEKGYFTKVYDGMFIPTSKKY